VIPAFPFYIFDLDGTLVDSAADICGAIQGVLSKTSQNAVSDEFLRSYIGKHLLELFNDLFPEYTPEQMDALVEEYRTLYPARGHAMTKAYPHAVEVLSQLSGRKATATTKGGANTRIVLERFGLLPYIDHVQGTDGFPAKPNPEVLFRAMAGLGAKPQECLFIGDSSADMEAAKKAGVQSCAVTYGYGQRADLAKWSPDYWIDDLRELLADFDAAVRSSA
jgi:HAD superfamily hydrolase (TIGR01509 family)